MTFIHMKISVIAALIFVCLNGPAAAQIDQKEAVTETLNDYLLGSSYNNPERIKAAFYEEADMFLHHPEKPIFLRTPSRYAEGFAKRERDVFNGRYGKILSIDIEGDIATAKAEILMPSYQSRYIDIFLLKKLDGRWKIISKAAGRADSLRSGERFLLIASDKGLGEDFSDLIADYEKAVQAGYTVDIASPKGGAIAFNGVNMSDPYHRDYIYNADFIYALKHTLRAADLKASDYVSAEYICDQDSKDLRSGHQDVDMLYAKICDGENKCTN